MTGHFRKLFITTMKYETWVVSYRRFGTTCRVPYPRFKLNLYPLKMGPIGCPETSVTDYQIMLRKSPNERKYHVGRGGTLKSRMVK
jgi:hypothetical protein